MTKAINVAAVAFDYCEKHGRLHNIPMKGIVRYGDDSREVGILSTDEVEALFSAEWGKPVCRLANILAATTGMRAGEISGLRYCDLGKDRIFINHAWGINDGLKSTKTNKKKGGSCPAKHDFRPEGTYGGEPRVQPRQFRVLVSSQKRA